MCTTELQQVTFHYPSTILQIKAVAHNTIVTAHF